MLPESLKFEVTSLMEAIEFSIFTLSLRNIQPVRKTKISLETYITYLLLFIFRKIVIYIFMNVNICVYENIHVNLCVIFPRTIQSITNEYLYKSKPL